jgi:hypothetical protein
MLLGVDLDMGMQDLIRSDAHHTFSVSIRFSLANKRGRPERRPLNIKYGGAARSAAYLAISRTARSTTPPTIYLSGLK